MAVTALRSSGVSLIAGAALLGTAIVMASFSPVVNQPLSPRISLLLLLSSVFLQLSLPAMYAKQAGAAGWLGLTGHALLQTGILLTGIATIRAGIFPQWAGILLLAATAGFFFVFFVAEFLPAQAGQLGAAFFGILLTLALAWIGLSLWRA